VHRIFNRKKMAIQRIHDSALFGMLAGFLAADALLMIPFTVQSPLHRTLTYGEVNYHPESDLLIQEYASFLFMSP
jgi:hypothetical protein